ncbi:MAG: hypothetical protein MJ168_10925 [Clostridia bacterium]|nr:hypothetical protein [Clostridia bacterium]
MEREKVNYTQIMTIVFTLLSWGITGGICLQKVDNNTRYIERIEKQHAADINKLENRQDSSDALLRSINTQLVELNTKMNLLLNGEIKAEKNK